MSYVAGTSDDPLKYMTVAQLLDRACARYGGRTAAIFARKSCRCPGTICATRANDVAAGLLALGIGRGDRVGIWAPNRAEWLYTQFGTARIGAILVNINPAHRPSELGYALNKVGCKALIMARRHRSSDYVETLRAHAGDRPASQFAASGEASASQTRRAARRRSASRWRPFVLSVHVARRACPSQPVGGIVRRARSRRRHQYPVHQRHHGVPKARHCPISTSSTTPLRRPAMGLRPKIVCVFRCRSIIASAW